MAEHESVEHEHQAAHREVTTRPAVSSGIVVGHDGSERSQAAVRWAAEEAAVRGCALHVVRAWTVTHAPRPSTWSFGYVPSLPEYETAVTEVLEDAWQGLREHVPELHLHAAHGKPARIIVEASRGADLVVVGSRGQGRVAEFALGSVADQVAREARCPVVVVRPSTTDPLGGVADPLGGD
ncbi:hypothetical protein BH20ACT6_BH20ACT6_20660 [soil metagenome]